VEKVMQTLIDSERKELEQNELKKKKAFEDMKFALELKEKKKAELEELERLENQKFAAHIK
jgi:hypothetical protein